ncbi:unnamed protein product [Zymoseptoria tritici ST99CH_1A5]|uniref:Uncharacterized protein n=2 Tax=Zymoseptoria tritici TaxID=1047171 RepID=A0A1X7S2T5_ZYMT9|nr:unnamed protein product [Zymoseptoria tritici ST99CH_3D7]SMY27620.1 unnamed protein product [Zymoseptoria tritici ST99CH_1A5]
MASPSPDDELLLILLRNLQNASSTFGEKSQPYNDILSTVNEHLQDMKRKGITTNIAQARGLLGDVEATADSTPAASSNSNPFGALAFRPRPKS